MEDVPVLKSARDLVDRWEELVEREPGMYMFRGHGKADWHLVPSVGRMYEQVKDSYEGWSVVEAQLVSDFRKYSRQFVGQEPRGWIEWLVMVQHHGLPTRLLDWTTNPLKGLFFAVDDPKHWEEDGRLWAFDSRGYWDVGPEKEVGSGFAGWVEAVRDEHTSSVEAFYPDHVDARVIAQESCFTKFPFPKEFVAIPPLETLVPYGLKKGQLHEFRVPRGAKVGIRRELGQLGVCFRTLFPDLDGLATSLRRDHDLLW